LYYLEPTTKPIKETTNQIPHSEFAASVSTSTNREFDSNNIANDAQNNAMNGTPAVTVYIGIVVAILILLTAIVVVVVTLVLLYLRKASQTKPKADDHYDDSYSTLCRGETQQLQPHSQQPPTDLYDQIQLSPSTGQAEKVSKAEIENINIPSSHQISISPDTATSEHPTYAAVKKKSKVMKLRQHQNNAAAVEKN
jgi:hypothetical protein